MRSTGNSDRAPTVVGAVIVCAGTGSRSGLPYNKVLHYIGQKTAVELVLDAFSRSCASRTVLVSSPADERRMSEIAEQYQNVTVCVGGATRAESVKLGLDALGACDIAVIHDGARPFVTPELIQSTVDSAIEHGSGVAAVRAVDTVKRVSGKKIIAHLDRSELYCMQTPQTFRYSEIYAAYESLGSSAYECTDDAEVYGRAGHSACVVDGSYRNIKLTTASDLFRAMPLGIKIGVGFDVHKLVAGRKLILGGIDIPFEKGLDGHSDADVLTHAVMDALLSAAGLPDIGVLFPDTDDRFLGASSMKLLGEVTERVRAEGTIRSVSAVVIAQRPKFAGYISSMRKSLATALGIDERSVNVSATTTEHLGIIGDGEAIAASASCLLEDK